MKTHGLPLDAVELAWERSTPLPHIDPAFLEEHTAPWPELGRRQWTVLGGGLRSLNLRSDELVLRIALDGSNSLIKEAALLAELPAGVRVPKVFEVSDRALVMEYVPHTSLPPTELAGRRAGEAAARFHARSFEQAGMLDERLQVAQPFSTSLDGLRGWAESLLGGRAGRRLGIDRVGAVSGLWDAHHHRLAAESSAPVLVHSDYKPTNVKWLPEEQDVLVLDWEFAWAGPALFDVGMMLRWSPPEAFVTGFAQGLGQLPGDWRWLSELFDLFNLVAFLDSEAERPQRDQDVLGRIDQTLAGNQR